MTTYANPFARGYRRFTIRRVLLITYDDDCPSRYRPLHPSQAHLRDDEVQLSACIFCEDFALVTEGQVLSPELDNSCPRSGVVRVVRYEITADAFGRPVHIGDACSAESARQVVEQLTFATGHYNRCWEINSAHLPAPTIQYLQHLADSSIPTGLMFEAFRMPGHAVGCKLLCTPWTGEPFESHFSEEPQTLRQLQIRADTPEALVDLLHLAAFADTRILILDPHAPELNGLRKYE
jgi:hypothetical protein